MISQTVGATVVQGLTYTLMVDIGWRLDLAMGGTADLKISDGTASGTTTILATGLTPVRGTFGTFTATYIGQAADVGKSITIELRSTNVAASQGNFDNVLLDEVAPEPASFLLIGSALLALTAVGRRRKKS